MQHCGVGLSYANLMVILAPIAQSFIELKTSSCSQDDLFLRPLSLIRLQPIHLLVLVFFGMEIYHPKGFSAFTLVKEACVIIFLDRLSVLHKLYCFLKTILYWNK